MASQVLPRMAKVKAILQLHDCPNRLVCEYIMATPGSGIMARQWACGYSQDIPWVIPFFAGREILFNPKVGPDCFFLRRQWAYLYLPRSPYLRPVAPLIFCLSERLSYI